MPDIEMLDASLTTQHDSKDAVVPTTSALSSRELELLEVYDRLDEIALETALLHAQTTVPEPTTAVHEPTDAELEQAEQAVLDARAAYDLRNRIITNVLVADPILKTVHGAPDQLPPPLQALQPLIARRDALSMEHAKLATELNEVLKQLTTAEAEQQGVMESNRTMTQTLLGLANEAKGITKEDVTDARLRTQIEKLEADVREKRKRWRVLKDVTMGVVVASGVDWAGNDELRDLVIDRDEFGD